MAKEKDNLNTASGPGKAKTKEKGKTGAKKKPKQWVKADWIKRAQEAGVENADKMTKQAIIDKLKQLKKDGLLEDKRGGAREGAGAPASLNKSEFVKDVKEKMITEEVEIIIRNKGTGEATRTKMNALEALLYKLRAKAVESTDTREMVAAMHEFFDRTLGKATQEVEHSGEIKVEEQRLPTRAEKAAAKAYLDNLDEDE